MDKHHFQAVIFDLDGVITKTALVHSTAWKEMFNNYLHYREQKYGEPFREFTHQDDYLSYVDGKPRYEGVASFLESRGISIPYGNPSDPPDKESVCGLGNKKNNFFNDILQRDGVEVFESTLELIRELRKEGIRIGVASSSKNCKPILERAGILDLFETNVDGVVSAELGLKGKPEPDIFRTACDNLGVDYENSVVVEDAVSGVQAGFNGRFGLVIGIAREENADDLKNNGADIVIEDMKHIDGIQGIDEWFRTGLNEQKWSIAYHDYDVTKEKSREAILTVGNGYFGIRGAMEETDANPSNYPGTYMAGVYNRKISKIAGRDIENEDFVNCPNGLRTTFKINNGPWFDPNKVDILKIDRKLDFRTGLFSRYMIVRDTKGKETQIESSRFASMADPHLAGIRYKLKPLNYSGDLIIRSSLNGNIINEGVERYKQLNQRHLEPIEQRGNQNTQSLRVRTNQSKIEIAEHASITVYLDDAEIHPEFEHHIKPGRIDSDCSVHVTEGKTLMVEKVITLVHSGEVHFLHSLSDTERKMTAAGDFERWFRESTVKWNELWEKADIEIVGDRYVQKLVRMHIYHLLVTASPHNILLDTGIPARGLHGEAYRGHIFWDELYILPFYDLHFPEVAKSILMYRYRRLNKAREYATENGFRGAMYPWQSSSDGREETQIIHLNPVSGEWGPDYSSLQRHISLAIAYNIWYYYWITADSTFMEDNGTEMFLEICRFWASKCRYNKKTDRYSIDQVMGPDEFHEKYPDGQEGGLKDNAYINLMVAWLFEKAFYLMEHLNSDQIRKIREKIDLNDIEIDAWREIMRKLNLVFSEQGIIAQFDGYFDLEELDWEAYRAKYGNIHRMDRILKAEGKSPDDYKVAKQADTLMTFYNLDLEEIRKILERMGYPPDAELLRKNFDYYFTRTSHGSTLSRIVHAFLANRIGKKELAWRLYMEALTSDYIDIQGGTTAEGIHAGVMGSTVLFVINALAGINFRSDNIRVFPRLPEHWKKIKFNFAFRKIYYTFEISPKLVKVKADRPDKQKVTVEISGESRTIECGSREEFKLTERD